MESGDKFSKQAILAKNASAGPKKTIEVVETIKKHVLLGKQCLYIQKMWKKTLFLRILSFLGRKWLKKDHFWCSQNPVTSRYYGEKPTIDGENEVRLASLSTFSLLLCDTLKKKTSIIGVILRKTKGFGGLGLCPLDSQWKNKEFQKKNLPRVPPKWNWRRISLRYPLSKVSSYLKVTYDDVMPINNHVISEEEKWKL